MCMHTHTPTHTLSPTRAHTRTAHTPTHTHTAHTHIFTHIGSLSILPSLTCYRMLSDPLSPALPVPLLMLTF